MAAACQPTSSSVDESLPPKKPAASAAKRTPRPSVAEALSSRAYESISSATEARDIVRRHRASRRRILSPEAIRAEVLDAYSHTSASEAFWTGWRAAGSPSSAYRHGPFAEDTFEDYCWLQGYSAQALALRAIEQQANGERLTGDWVGRLLKIWRA